jgi:WD40 repeat protein/serine/threonine protein kinase
MTEREIFFEALEMSTPEARAAYLQGACGRDVTLRHKVDELLKEHFSNDSLLAGPALEGERAAVAESTADDAPAQMLGRYKLLEKLGEGGFGEVWMAEQHEPVKRRVALKIIKLGMDSRQIVARFEAERQALAMMDHPNIAKIFDAGTTEPSHPGSNGRESALTSRSGDQSRLTSAATIGLGRPYFVMELVRGIKITEYCDQNHLPTRERLDLFIKVCQAIQHAHQKGVIHRDIKPSNILVALHDGPAAAGVPKVIDFGIAKATQQELTDKTVFTQFQQFIGTPAYISPEQAEMSGLDIDTRADIYSLGVLLYELLVGQTPFDAKEMMQGNLDALRRIIREKEPLRPSTKLNTLQGDARTTAGKCRQTDVGKLVHQLQGDLDWIVMKCLEKDRTRRYETANGLAADIQRHLANEPVIARPPSAAYKLQKAFRRNKLVFTAGAVVAVALVAGIGVSTWQAMRATKASISARKANAGEKEQRLAAEAERQRAERNADELIKSLYVADMRTAWQAVQDDNLLLARESVYKYLPTLGIPISSRERASPLAESTVGSRYPGALTRDLLGWEWRRLWALCQSDETFTLHGDGLEIRCAVFSPDSRLVATARGQTVYVTDAHTKKQLAALGGFSGVIDNSAVAFSRDGQYLAAKGGTNVLIWEVGRWEFPYQRLLGAANSLNNHGNAVLFFPDGGRFVTRVNGGLSVWDTTTWQEEILPGKSEFGLFLSFAGDGEWLAASEGSKIKILNAGSLEEVRTLPGPNAGNFRVLAIDSCPKRGLLAAGYRDGEVRFWQVGSWREVGTFQPHPSFAFGLAFSPDGNVLVTGGNEQVIKVWDVTSLTNDLSAARPREPLEKPKDHPAMELPGRLPPERGPQPLKRLRGHHANIHGLSFAPDGQSVVTASKDGTAKLWNPLRAVESTMLPNSERLAWFSPDGARLLTLNRDGRLHRWHTRNREDIGAIGPDLHDPQVKAWTISDHGETLAVGRANGIIEIWNLKTSQLDRSFPHVGARIAHLAFSQDAILLAAASERPSGGAADPATLRIWETASGVIAGTVSNAFGPLAFSSDRQRLVSIRLGGSVVVWDLGSARSVAEIEENITWVGALALSPDDRLLITGSEEPVVNISELASGKRIDSLKGSRVCTVGVGFCPDARTLATRTTDGAMKFWNAATGKEMFTLGPPNPVHSFLFSPDGEYLAITWGSWRVPERGVELWSAPSFEEIIAAENAKARKK